MLQLGSFEHVCLDSRRFRGLLGKRIFFFRGFFVRFFRFDFGLFFINFFFLFRLTLAFVLLGSFQGLSQLLLFSLLGCKLQLYLGPLISSNLRLILLDLLLHLSEYLLLHEFLILLLFLVKLELPTLFVDFLPLIFSLLNLGFLLGDTLCLFSFLSVEPSLQFLLAACHDAGDRGIGPDFGLFLGRFDFLLELFVDFSKPLLDVFLLGILLGSQLCDLSLHLSLDARLGGALLALDSLQLRQLPLGLLKVLLEGGRVALFDVEGARQVLLLDLCRLECGVHLSLSDFHGGKIGLGLVQASFLLEEFLLLDRPGLRNVTQRLLLQIDDCKGACRIGLCGS